MKVEIKQEHIDWITNPVWHPEYKKLDNANRDKAIQEQINDMIQSYIDEVEDARSE